MERLEQQVKEVISELFGKAPSIGDKQRVKIEQLSNDKGDYLAITLDGVAIAKMDGEKVVYAPSFDKIKEDIHHERAFYFRCSSAGKLMTMPRGKSNYEKFVEAKEAREKVINDLEKCSEKAVKTREKLEQKLEQLDRDVMMLEEVAHVVELSETAKGEIKKVWIETELGRKRAVTGYALEKGTVQEVESLRILSAFDGYNYVKNEERQVDEELRLTGEIDTKRETKEGVEIVDIKTRLDADSFFSQNEDEQNKHEADQLDAYLILNPDAKLATIANVLTSNSDDAIRREVYVKSLRYENGEMPLAEQIKIIKEQVFDEQNFIRLVNDICGDISNDAEALDAFESFREIPLEMRVIKITRERDEERLEQMKAQLSRCFDFAKKTYNLV